MAIEPLGAAEDGPSSRAKLNTVITEANKVAPLATLSGGAIEAVSDAQLIGAQTVPVSAPVLSNTTYIFAAPVAAAGFITRIKGYGPNAGTLKIKRFSRAGDVFTQIGADVDVAVPLGAYELTLSSVAVIAVNAGDYLGFYAGSSGVVVGRTVGGTPSTPFYSNAAGGGNVSSITDASADSSTRFELAFVVSAPASLSPRMTTAETQLSAALEAIGSILAASGTYSPALLLLTRDGYWYDFADRNSLYSDRSGAVPVAADADPLGFVRDKSGHGYHFAAANDGLRLEHKRNVVDGRSVARVASGRYLTAQKNSFARAISKMTIWAVARFNSPSGDQAVIEHMTWPSASVARIWLGNLALAISGSRLAAAIRQSDGGASTIVASFRIADANYVIQELAVDFAGGKANLFTNGRMTVEGYAKLPGTTPTDNTDSLASYLGGSAPAADSFAGDICEIIGVAGEVTEEERAGLYAYLSAKWGDIPLGDLKFYDPTGPLPTIWLWFNGPRVIEYAASKFAVAGVASGGSVMVGDYDFSGAELEIAHAVLMQRWQVDDHADPALLKLPDGNILAAFTRHGVGDGSYYVTRTLTPGDLSAWSAPVNIKASINPGGADRFSYHNLIRLPDESGRIYLFFRDQNLTTNDEYWCYSTSDDNGVTWATGKRLWGPQRPYTKFVQNGDDRIDFLFNDSHPGTVANNNTYHAYYRAGNFYKSDGTLIGDTTALPIAFETAATKVYDAVTAGLGGSWIWDIIPAPVTAYPVGCIAIFTPAAPTYDDHRYHQVRWNGAAWTRHEICAAGGPLIPTQPAYSGGVITDPENIDVVYCSRQVDGAGNVSLSGVYQLFKYVTADGGASWTGTQLTFGPKPCFRPFIAPGTRKLWYITGDYGPTYADWDTKVAVMDIA